MQLFGAMGVGALIKLLGDAGVFSASNTFTLAVGKVKESFVRLGLTKDAPTIAAGGVTTFQAPGVSPAYLGVGYIIGPELGALNFAGGLLAWGLFVPLLVFFLGPQLAPGYTDAAGAHGLGRASPATSGASSSGRSRSAACSSAPASPSSGCARTWSSASSAGSPTSRSRRPPPRPPRAPSATSPSRPSSSGSRSCSS